VKLIEVVETDKKIGIILEYASGKDKGGDEGDGCHIVYSFVVIFVDSDYSRRRTV
jgi:hypothetical protein